MPQDIFEIDDKDLLEKRVQRIEEFLSGFSARNLAGIKPSDLIDITAANLFGDGSDGTVSITGTTTLTTDKFYDNLTVESGGILNTASFRVFVKDTLNIKSGGIIRNNGNTGNNGTASTPGNGATAIASGSIPGGVAGAQ